MKAPFIRKIFNANEIVSLIDNGFLNCPSPQCNNLIQYYCSSCQKSFCAKCIKEELQKSNSCPKCKTIDPVMENINEVPQLKYLLKHVRANDLQERNIDLAFKCRICKRLLKDPISCMNCNSSFCNKCFQNKRMKENKCPKC